MARKTNAVLAFALSAALALGTLPAPALAEMAAEAGFATTTQGTSADAAESNSLDRATLALVSSELPWSGLPARVLATVTSDDGTELARGTDYELAYYAADGFELNSAPSAPGSYLVSARGVAGGAWVGETDPIAFKVSAPQAADLVAGRTEVELAEGAGWVGKVSAPGTYRVTVSSDVKVDAAAYADADLSEKVAAADASGQLELTVAEGSAAWVTLSQPDGVAVSASVELTAANEPAAPQPTTPEPAAPETPPEPAAPALATEADQPADATMGDSGPALSVQAEFSYVVVGKFTLPLDENLLWRDENYYPVYYSPTGSFSPLVTVEAKDENNRTITLTEGIDYTLSRVLVDSQSGLYRCEVTGINAYQGCYSNDKYYRVVSSIDLESYAEVIKSQNRNTYVMCGPHKTTFLFGWRSISTRYPGEPFIPYVRFERTQYSLKQGVDFDVVVRDAEGQLQPTITGPGSYTITMTAKEGSIFSGSVTLPRLDLTSTFDIGSVIAGLAYDMKESVFPAIIMRGDDGIYYLNEGLNGLDPLSFFSIANDSVLVENVDYTVERTFEDECVNLLLKGMGGYSGTKEFRLRPLSRLEMFRGCGRLRQSQAVGKRHDRPHTRNGLRGGLLYGHAASGHHHGQPAHHDSGQAEGARPIRGLLSGHMDYHALCAASSCRPRVRRCGRRCDQRREVSGEAG